MKDTHVMIDIETLGTKPGSVIASIGAVAFDPVTGTQDDTFYVEISGEDAARRGLTMDVATVRWWMEQSVASRTGLEGIVPLDQALHQFGLFLTGQRMRCTGSEQWLWANSPDFDIVLLEAAYRAIGLNPPWPHNRRLDLRTLRYLTGAKVAHTKLTEGLRHNALADARHQALIVAEGYRVLRTGELSLGRGR